jgi:hypothetical protein
MKFTSTTQTASWFRDQYIEGRLKLRPPYQRKPVWAARQKCYLIESILLGLPVPEIYVQATTSADTGTTLFEIVDGQQRIRTILQFMGSEQDPDEASANKFLLDKLPSSSRWQNKTFADLTQEERSGFYAYKLSVRELDASSDSEIRDMFTRLNKYLEKLKPQEVRNATYTGPFVQVATRLADDDYWVVNRIITPAAVRRMSDVEFVSELLIGVAHGPQAGNATVIDSYYAMYEDYDDEFPDQQRIEDLYRRVLTQIRQLLPSLDGQRWKNKSDFYSLFVAMSWVIGNIGVPRAASRTALRKELGDFAAEVNLRLSDEKAQVSDQAIAYVRAVEKGVNDRSRRSERHQILVKMLQRHVESGSTRG